MTKKKNGGAPPIPQIPRLTNPSAIATVEEYLATDAMQEWIRLRKMGEHRVQMPVSLSATGAAIVPEQFSHGVPSRGQFDRVEVGHDQAFGTISRLHLLTIEIAFTPEVNPVSICP